uniref:NADH-ubiquinone oxidoreductase chain 2 n=1 Tax=Candida verbasci TaxID=1227364 RepID=A0A977LL06_9ASCO|nr:NADH dehydrogenase subunit 2 [Candida verbasci]UXG56609.1 NADH dehydrogenase subunit 2 [Candida verbasci]
MTLMLTSFITMYTAYNTNEQLSARTAVIGTAITGLLALSCTDIQYSGFTFYNDWFRFTSSNTPIITIMLFTMILLVAYLTVNHRYTMPAPWLIGLITINGIGLMLLPAVNDLLITYMVIELQSYSLYTITGVYNKSYNATRGAMTYFLTGGIASIAITVASVYIYKYTGTTNLYDLSMMYEYSKDSLINPMYMLTGALMFKMGLAPLHAWSIAVYNYAPTIVTAYISIVAKVAISGWLFANANTLGPYVLYMVFYISLMTAAIMPLYQVNIKTMLAYSGMTNFGYLLLPILLQDPSYYIYTMQYVITHMVIFICLLATNEYMMKPNTRWSPMVLVNELMMPNRIMALSLIMCLLSLMGMPPLPGFYGKFSIITGLMDAGLSLPVLSIMLFSVMATYYYAFIIKQLSLSLYMTPVMPQGSKVVGLMLGMLMTFLLTYYITVPFLLEGLTMMSY